MENPIQVPHECSLKNPGHFDARFFNMLAQEAAQNDPAQRLAIITAYEALKCLASSPVEPLLHCEIA